MNTKNRVFALEPMTVWERWAFLLGRLTLLLGMAYAPIVFWVYTWRHYQIPKTTTFQFLILVAVACWAIIAIKRRFVRSSLAQPASFFFVAVVLSTLFAVNMGESLEVLQFTAACLIMAVLVPKFFTRSKDFYLVAYLWGILCLFIGGYGLAQRFDWVWFFNIFESYGFSKLTNAPVSTMGNRNYTAEWFNVSLPVMFCMMIHCRRKPFEFLFYSFVTLFSAITVYFIDCRATVMGLYAALAVVLPVWAYYRILPSLVRRGFIPTTRRFAELRFRQAMVVAVLIASLGATAIMSFPNLIRFKVATFISWVDITGDNIPDGNPTVMFRLLCFDATVRNIFQDPITGFGPGNFKVIHPYYEEQLERKILGEETLARKVHNDHLQHAVKHGVFGLFGWYWLIAALLVAGFLSLRLLRAQDLIDHGEADSTHRFAHPLKEDERGLFFYFQLGILGAVICSMVSCLFGHSFVIPGSAVMCWFAIGMGMAAYQRLHRAHRGVPQPDYGVTPEAPTAIQRTGGQIPGVGRWMLFFALILPLGALNTYQLIGETWLKTAMIQKDVNPPRYADMFHSFQQAMRYYPYQMETFYILGRYYIDAAIEIRNAQADPEAGAQRLAQIRMPSKYVNREDILLREAIVCLQIDLFMNPIYKWAHNNLGVLYDRMSEVDMPERGHSFALARAAYDRVFEIDDEQIFAHFNTGLGYYRQGMYENAIGSFERTLMIDPNYTDAYLYLSLSFVNSGNTMRGLSAADAYIAQMIVRQIRGHLGDPEGQMRFATLVEHLQTASILEALQEANRLITFRNAQASQIYGAIAYRLAERGDSPELTHRTLQKADLLIDRMDVSRTLAFAQIYQNLGDLINSLRQYDDYLQLNPGDMETRRVVANLYVAKAQQPSDATEMVFEDARFADLTRGDMFTRALGVMEPVLQASPTWRDYFQVTQIKLGAGRFTWPDIFPYIELTIQTGGDEAREVFVNDPNREVFRDFINQDPRFQQLLGDRYMTILNGPHD